MCPSPTPTRSAVGFGRELPGRHRDKDADARLHPEPDRWRAARSEVLSVLRGVMPVVRRKTVGPPLLPAALSRRLFPSGAAAGLGVPLRRGPLWRALRR
ncbi:Cell division protein FtsK [Actinacidiphila bryophytorum]|uniref:Cell division protein FtsK n=1 Tax=Actinacidiphila bryophytorum TaxID=1436133 RepID=A0A9W4MAV2_9ACTN|nr:Cell division protein FtsK [Actinacidiphila bryophytorum]